MNKIEQSFAGIRFEKKPYLVLLAAAAIAFLPNVFFRNTNDMPQHLVWYGEFAKQLLSGDLYPRWLYGNNMGLGSAAFLVYGPIAFYVASAFHWLSFISNSGLIQIYASIFIAVFLSGASCYLILKEEFDNHTALLCGLVYMLSPYLISVDLYLRFAFGEIWAFVWLPCCFGFIRQMVEGKPKTWLKLSLAAAMLSYSHPPTLIIASPFMVAYFIFHLHRRSSKEYRSILLNAAMSATLWLLLSAAILVPTVLTRNLLALDGILHQPINGYQDNFLLTIPMGELCVVISIFIFIYALFTYELRLRAKKSWLEEGECIFWLTAMLVCVAIATPVSRWLWDALPLLQHLHFPWRFMSCLSLFFVFLLARQTNKTGGYPQIIAFQFLIIAFASGVYSAAHHNDEKWGYYESKILPNKIVHSNDVNTKWVNQEYFQMNYPDFIIDAPLIKLTSGKAKISATEGEAGEVTVSVDAESPSSITVKRFYFPYWKLYKGGDKITDNLSPSEPEGFTVIRLDEGKYDLRLVFEEPKWIRLCEVVSLISFIMVLFWLVKTKAIKQL